MNKERSLKHSDLTPERLAYLRRLNEQAKGCHETLAEMALAWVLNQKGITSVLVGVSSVEQLVKDLEAIHAAPFVEKL